MYKLCGEIHGDLFIDNFTICEFNLSKMKNPCYNKYAFIKMLNYNEDELNQKCIGDEDMEKYNKEI